MQKISFIAFSSLLGALVHVATGCGPKGPLDGATVSLEETITAVDGTVPRKLTVITAAAQCPISTDCSRGWTDRYVKAVFQDHDPDIVIMTEFFWNATYANMIDQVQRVRPNTYNFFRGPKEGFIAGWGGAVIASKYVMSDKAEHEYDNCLNPDCFTDKGTIVARQHVGKLADGREISLDVLATHFQAKTIGNFVSVIGEQMGEQRGFLEHAWRDTRGSLKIYSGDLNVAGDGPSWLATGGHSGADARGRDTFFWLRDNVLLPYGMRDGLDTCDSGGGTKAAACAGRPFREVETGDVVKQFHTPSGELRGPNGESTNDHILLVPEKYEGFDTGSDHWGKLVKYALYKRTGVIKVSWPDGGGPSLDGGGHARDAAVADAVADGGVEAAVDAGPKDGTEPETCVGVMEGWYCSKSEPSNYYLCAADKKTSYACPAGEHCVRGDMGETGCSQ